MVVNRGSEQQGRNIGNGTGGNNHIKNGFCLYISAVTIPVGTAIIPYPMIIISEATSCPNGVWGAMSPYPTVVNVTIHQ